MGDRYSCALLSDGSVKCWGYNSSGQLGDGTTTDRHTPVSVQNISTGVQIALGYNHSCALLSDGTIKCWGDNAYGQLGDGTTTDRHTPVSVSSLDVGKWCRQRGTYAIPQRTNDPNGLVSDSGDCNMLWYMDFRDSDSSLH